MAAWLTSMQNGALGEARARAFLVERFWVLERSVDVQGADFLIQENDIAASVLAPRPPRFGVVQAKFAEAPTTVIRIPAAYLYKDIARPFGEFFLYFTTGFDDAERTFLLTSADVVENFDHKVDDKKDFFEIGASKLWALTNFEVTNSKSVALGKMQRALQAAEYFANRSFISGLGYGPRGVAPMADDLLQPIENSYGNLTESFSAWKKTVSSALGDMEWAGTLLEQILRDGEPESIASTFVELEEFIDGRGKLVFTAPKPIDELMTAVREHRAFLAALASRQRVGGWSAFVTTIKKELPLYLATVPNRDMKAIHLTASYDAETLAPFKVSFCGEDTQCAGTPISHRVIQVNSLEGRKDICFDARQFFGMRWGSGTGAASPDFVVAMLQRAMTFEITGETDASETHDPRQ